MLLLASRAEGPGQRLVMGEKSKQGESQGKQPLPTPAGPHQPGQHLGWAERDAPNGMGKAGKTLQPSLGPVGPGASTGLGIEVG